MFNRLTSFKISLFLFITGFLFALILTYKYSFNYGRLPKIPSFYHDLTFRDPSIRSPPALESFTLNTNKSNLNPQKEKITVVFIFTHVNTRTNLQHKFYACLSTLVNNTDSPLSFILISDQTSLNVAKAIFTAIIPYTHSSIEVDVYNVEWVASQLTDLVSVLQPHFSSGSGTYYHDSLFFLSAGLHRVMPPGRGRVIMLDADTQLAGNIAELHQEFDRFDPQAIMGLAWEQQPVYRHLLYAHLRDNNDSIAGMPPPRGQPGFNSGVVLLDLHRMRSSALYGSLLSSTSVAAMAAKYQFQGHLGDQDFYTLASFDHPELFHVIPCNWNRQLCTWWRDHGYRDIFDSYHRCRGPVKLYHGNCNTPIVIGAS